MGLTGRSKRKKDRNLPSDASSEGGPTSQNGVTEQLQHIANTLNTINDRFAVVEQRVDAISGDVQQLASTVQQLNSTVQLIMGKVDSLETTVAQMQTRIADLENQSTQVPRAAPQPDTPMADAGGPPARGPVDRRTRLLIHGVNSLTENSRPVQVAGAVYHGLTSMQGAGVDTAVLQRVRIDFALRLRGGAVVVQFATSLDRDAVLGMGRLLYQQHQWRVRTDEDAPTRAARRQMNNVHQVFHDSGLLPRWRGATLLYRQADGTFVAYDAAKDDVAEITHRHGKNKRPVAPQPPTMGQADGSTANAAGAASAHTRIPPTQAPTQRTGAAAGPSRVPHTAD